MSSLPGVHVAELVDSMNTGGLITSADILNDSIVVLLGYNIGGPSEVFVWMLSDFQPGHFFNGNKRKLTCGPFFTIGQAEGILLNKDLTGFITNENVQSVVLPQLKKFDLNPYFALTSGLENSKPDQDLISFMNNQLLIHDKAIGSVIYIFNDVGQQVLHLKPTGSIVNLANLHAGLYHVKLIKDANTTVLTVFVSSE